MKIVRCANPNDAPKITCVGCGKRAREAGVVLSNTLVAKISGKNLVFLDDDDEAQTQSLCMQCVSVLDKESDQ